MARVLGIMYIWDLRVLDNQIFHVKQQQSTQTYMAASCIHGVVGSGLAS